MDQDCVTERDAISTIENETHPWASMGAKLVLVDGDRYEAQINRESVGPGTPFVADNVYTLTADIDPSAWGIVDGKLYLNKSKSIKQRWKKDLAGFIEKADANWPEISSR